MSEAANFFDMIADAQTPAPVKRKIARDVERAIRKREAEQDLADEGRQVTIYRQWRRAQRDRLRSGPHGKEVRGLIEFMKGMSLSSAPALLGMVERATFWRSMSLDERFALLALLNAGIAACRARNNLPPLDDAIPWLGEAPKASEKLKTMLGLDGR